MTAPDRSTPPDKGAVRDQEDGTLQSEIPISEWQRLTGEWTDSRFDNDDLSQRALVLAEEAGEVARCVVKARQGIRGGADRWLAELPGEVADVFFCLAAIAHRAGFDLNDAIEAKWLDLSNRSYASMRSEEVTR